MKAYDNKTPLLKTVLKTVLDPPLVALRELKQEPEISGTSLNYSGAHMIFPS